MNELVKFDTPELQVIEKSKAEQIKATFEPMAEMLSEFEERYNKLMAIPLEEITVDLTKEYKRLRLDVGRVRIDTGKAKDKAKEYLKLEDKAIMGVHNILIWAVKEKEDNLKERENYFEIQEQKRLEALQLERAEKLAPYVEDAHERDLVKFADDEFEALLAMKKKEQEDRIAAEKKAEEERIAEAKAEAARIEAQRIENERLKAEAIEREKHAKLEQEKRDKEVAELKAKQDAERKANELALQKEREEREKMEREEKAKREKLEAELKAKQDAEIKAKRDAELALQNELNKVDSDKVKDLATELEILKTKYSFKSAKNKKMYADVGALIDKLINHINK